MFCYQCEQTAKGTGCQFKMGVCGKPANTADLQDKLIGALIALAKVTPMDTELPRSAVEVMLNGLFTTVTNVSYDDNAINEQIALVRDEYKAMGGTEADEYDMQKVFQGKDADICSLKSLILFGLKGIAAYAHHALILGYHDAAVDKFFFTGLKAVGDDNATMESLLPLVMRTGQANLKCMEILDKANRCTYGQPQPTEVTMTIEKGPFIVITGHDLKDLALLLHQTRGRGINIYTHGEMLPAHAYPKLKAYEHFKGNFGTAWQNQQKEFDHIPAPVLFTTNCIMPVQASYADRVFTTAMVAYPGMQHIDWHKDFTPIIEKALELGGYTEAKKMTGINGGTKVTTGFGHDAVLAAAGTVIDAVKAGALKHIFLVGGCDGARMDRTYYTDFVKATPPDTLVLTLACGKYRFNDLDLGTLGGLPRILDMGQCNDAYSAIKVATELAKAFDTDVNGLPLTLVLSWYEQKAVAILLTLLSLGIKNMLIGPSLPAFISPNVLNLLVKEYQLTPISTPEADLKRILS